MKTARWIFTKHFYVPREIVFEIVFDLKHSVRPLTPGAAALKSLHVGPAVRPDFGSELIKVLYSAYKVDKDKL